MGSSSGVTGSEDTLHQRNVMDSRQKEVEMQDEPGPAQEVTKCKKTIGRTPDGVGGFTTPFQLEVVRGTSDERDSLHGPPNT